MSLEFSVVILVFFFFKKKIVGVYFSLKKNPKSFLRFKVVSRRIWVFFLWLEVGDRAQD
jgi:hypothetical protein